MRILKLVIWDLDETILTGILVEGDEEINLAAARVMKQIDEKRFHRCSSARYFGLVNCRAPNLPGGQPNHGYRRRASQAREAIARLNRPGEHHVIVAEMKDVYGNMGHCGIIHLAPVQKDEALTESLAISCRTRARGLSLAMLMGLLRYPTAKFQKYHCRYVFNGSNRPLRMLLMGAGFKPQSGTEVLVLDADQLTNVELPDWVHIGYQPQQTQILESEASLRAERNRA